MAEYDYEFDQFQQVVEKESIEDMEVYINYDIECSCCSNSRKLKFLRAIALELIKRLKKS